MKLLSLEEKKDELVKEEDIKRKKSDELNKSISRLSRELNDLKDKSVLDKISITKDYNDFVADINEKKSDLETEVNKLENRRKRALVPIDLELQSLKRKEVELSERESNLSKREEDFAIRKDGVDELADKYEERLGELTDLQANLQEREKHLAEKEAHFNHMMRYRESVLQKERARIRQLFEELDSRQKNNK